MGYSGYWHNGRFQGYGVPAYCDYKNCREEIHRGLAYLHPENAKSREAPSVFVCCKHKYSILNKIYVDLQKEHPDWLNFILNDETWDEWRGKNPYVVSFYKKILSNIHKVEKGRIMLFWLASDTIAYDLTQSNSAFEVKVFGHVCEFGDNEFDILCGY